MGTETTAEPVDVGMPSPSIAARAKEITIPASTKALPSVSPPSAPHRPPLCKHWARAKMCLYHDKGRCKFDHPLDYEPPPASQKNHRNRKSRQTDLSDRHRSAGGRLQTRNDARVAILRVFLAETLAQSGQEDLSTFDVLDVAGGKGELAFQLLNLNNVKSCHVVDPRPLALGRFQKRLARGFYHRSQGILQHDVVRPQSEPERKVEQLRCFFSSELWEEENDDDEETESGNETSTEESKDKDSKDESKKISNHEGNGDTGNNSNSSNGNGNNRHQTYQKQRNKFLENCYRARGWVWPPVGDANEHAAFSKYSYDDRDDAPTVSGNTGNNTSSQKSSQESSNPAVPSSNDSALDSDDHPIISFDHAAAVVKNADLILGMHPDQAVDAIVDAALYQNISFFVVPCCTYSREFPHRRVPVKVKCLPCTEENRPFATPRPMKLVTTYEELLEYLQAKSPDIRRHVLPFEGRNVCLYRVVAPNDSQPKQ